MWTFVFLEQLCLFFLIIFQLVDIHYHVTFKRAATFMYFMKWSPRGVRCPSDTVHGWLHSRVPAAALYTPTAIFTAGNLHFLNLFSFFCRSAPQSPSRLVYQFVLWSVSLFLSRFFWFLDSSCKWNRMVFIFLWFISLSIILSRSMLPIAGFVLFMAD